MHLYNFTSSKSIKVIFVFALSTLLLFFVFASAIFSQWLVVFGRNLYWSIWVFYLPVVVIMHYLKRAHVSMNGQLIKLGILVFMSVFIKCLFNGYEYITTTLLMMMTPFIYYSILHKLSFRAFLKGFLVSAFSSFLAISLSFSILCFQIGSVTGNLLDGVDHIVYSLRKRTYADPHKFTGYASSLEASPINVVVKYLEGSFFDANNYINGPNDFVVYFIYNVRYLYLIVLFLIMSGILCSRRNRHDSEKEKQRYIPLVVATWFSILAPLSWFLVFKAHSDIHTHMNYLVWQMPFTLFGFAVCGLVVKSMLSDLIRLTKRYVF